MLETLRWESTCCRWFLVPIRKTRATQTAGSNSGVGCLAGLHNDDRKLRLHGQLGNLWRCRFVLSPSKTVQGPLQKMPDLNFDTTAASPNASLLGLSHATDSSTEYSAFASKSAVPCGRQRAQSCPGRILLRARPCGGPGFAPVNRGRPSARSVELQAIHRRPLLHPRSPLHKAPPNPTCGACSSAAKFEWCVAQLLRKHPHERAIQRPAKTIFSNVLLTRTRLEFHVLEVLPFPVHVQLNSEMHRRAYRMSVRKSHVHGSKMA